MSQLDSAISTLVDEHGTFITKASDYHRRKNPARAEAVSDATGAEQARDGAQASETTTDQHEADALVAETSAQADQRAAHAAKRQAQEQVTQAKQARLHAEAVQAGDLDRYTQWLLDSPVANGSAVLDWVNDTFQVATGESLGLSTKNQLFAEDGSLLTFDAWLGPVGTYLIEDIWSDGSVGTAGYGFGSFLYVHDQNDGTLYDYAGAVFTHLEGPRAIAAQFGTGLMVRKATYIPRVLLALELERFPYSTFVAGNVSRDLFYTGAGETPPHYFGSLLTDEAGNVMTDEAGVAIMFE